MKDKKSKEPKQPVVEQIEEPKVKKAKKEKKSKEVEVQPIKTPKLKKQKVVKNREKWTHTYFKKFSGRSQDSYDLMLQEDYENAISRAHELLGITKNDYDLPFIITVPDAFGHKDRVSYRLDKKPDGTHSYLYDQALVTALFFGADSLFYYKVNIDHRSGHLAYDRAGEFNYFDIVHIQTNMKYDQPDTPKYITLDLEIGLADGHQVAFHLRNHRVHESYELPNLLTENEKKIIHLLKQKVRESRSL